jgi:NAD(P)-dependent dehydrogenase (short-subunit alcohol dehydrogenase family)
VTGAGSGSRATALAFAQQGARVVVSDMAEDRGHETVASISGAGQVTFVQLTFPSPRMRLPSCRPRSTRMAACARWTDVEPRSSRSPGTAAEPASANSG